MKTLDLTIRVDQEKHIDKGEPCNAWRCPIALAMLEQIPGVEHVFVDDNALSFRIGEDRFRITPPFEVTTAIDTYDRTGLMKPFSFPLVIS